ncbi:CDP-alcohol phosphatidyltransferase family protein [Croceitalea sp. P059]|uniref:CDP-alcohol phosphatidyltransferase family protein n=1 Tax=Croceitalea sp. P059 TaxID=3075601 RepID=UPI0028884518|nr:CDP-alcohol phosphatidyltransferase family protein [Croceitalea sp. P059]MDT0540118.1 CDP-alcohol phosphatidyltransferase family protein [Croceitalea sp. P059]
MSKLPRENQFLDLSDYGRPIANVIAKSLQNTAFTPIHVTFLFVASGLIAVFCILNEYYWATAFFLVLKSILDAADGELARLKNTPSYTGRYLDSISDMLLNLLILMTIWYSTDGSIAYTILAFLGLQLQGTLYNYYYVILRNQHHGDITSRVFENETPIALKGERQIHVNILFRIYSLLYGAFDKIIYNMDKKAVEGTRMPNWFMTAVSTFGLGFQLLLIGTMLVMDLKQYIVSFFIGYSIFILIFIAIRKLLN